MIMVPDRAERSVDVADVGLVENGSPADLFVNGIDHVHCTYLYDPATVISTKRRFVLEQPCDRWLGRGEDW